jgi:hypothetical protein
MRKDEKSYDMFEDTKWSNQKPEIEAQTNEKDQNLPHSPFSEFELIHQKTLFSGILSCCYIKQKQEPESPVFSGVRVA